MLGLYLHIPFCSAICNYCNFNRGLFDAELKARYVDALTTEIAESRDVAARASADTIYFGGGTPSLLEPSEIARLIAACRTRFAVSTDAEVTMEANPESVTAERLAGYRAAGVNRVSFGVQSFRDEELLRLSRLHGVSRAQLALQEARSAGFENVSLDLMMWLPGQSVAQWLESVDRAITASPDHMSLYMLEVYPNAPLRDEMARRRWSQAPDEDVASMYVAAMERLETAGFGQYEISNVARSGRESRHNLKYWSDGEWLGFGSGAHSTVSGTRWKNVSGTEDYLSAVASDDNLVAERRHLSADERLGDALFTGLRLSMGLDLDVMSHRYNVDIWQRYGADLAPFVCEGLLRHEGARLWLTRRGMLLAHEVMAVFV